MKTKLYIVFLFLSLVFYSNTFAVDVSNSSDFSQNFNNSGINTIKVQNDITLDPVNQRTATISIFGSSGAERLTVNLNILRFVPNWNDGLGVSLSSLTFSQASNGALELSGDGVGSHNFQLDLLTFIGNTSGSNGGAVYLHIQTQSQLPNNFFYLNNSVFTNNSALAGGAIYMASNNSQNPISFSITTGTFSQNRASAGNGGAVCNYVIGGRNVISSYTIIGNNLFSNNSAINGGAISNEAEGGNADNAFNISGTFTTNQASSCGGAIYSSLGKNGNSPYGGKNVYTISATFNGNRASDSGGAIYNYISKGQSTGAMYLSGSWNGNSAVSNGGAIYNYSDLDLYILSSSVFQNNKASFLGGAIYNAKGDIYLTSEATGDITFLGNSASQGSDIFAAAGSSLYINGNFGKIYFGGGIAGNGTISKSNNGMIYLENTSDNSNFKGQFNQNGGETQCEGLQ
jgi:predicted outer membrane repeat protein